jgi:hypothetical protein
MVFSYEPNFHVSFVGQKTNTEKPINIPNANGIKFYILNKVNGVIIDTQGRVHVYPKTRIGNYILNIIAVSNKKKLLGETRLVLFVRNENEEFDYPVEDVVNDDLDDSESDSSSDSDNKKNKKKKHNKKDDKKGSKKASKKNLLTNYKFTNIFDNVKSYNNRTYGITIIVFSLLVALINSIK